jgi:hypothetical protein
MPKRKIRRRRKSRLGLPPEEHDLLASEGMMGLDDVVHAVDLAVKRDDCMGAYWMLMKAHKMMGREVCHVRSAGKHPNMSVRGLEEKVTKLAEKVGISCVRFPKS